MPRLIDADELIERSYRERLENRELIEQMIESAPTVDAVPTDFHDRCMQIEIEKRLGMEEVVRCKDCKECEERHTANYLPFLYCKLHEHSVSYNVFCCWAERREDAEH